MEKEIKVKQLRHKAEMPLLILCLILTLIVWFGIIVGVVFFQVKLEEWTIPVMFGAITPVLGFVYMIRHHYWTTITDAVEITDKQFADVYDIYVRLAKEMGFGRGKGVLTTIPRLYLANGNGDINAFASKCQLHKGYIVIYSDLLEIAYKHNDLSGLAFVLAHELGHIKCGHVNTWRMMVEPIAALLLLNKSLSRAQEWTADRCAYYYAPEGKRSMMVLFAGKNLYSQIDFEAYLESVRNHKDGFWLKLSNFLADHAVGFRRMEAIKETEEKGWDVHGKML